jgi:hypothetical protein
MIKNQIKFDFSPLQVSLWFDMVRHGSASSPTKLKHLQRAGKKFTFGYPKSNNKKTPYL